MCNKYFNITFLLLLLAMAGTVVAVNVKVDFGSKASDWDGASNTMAGFTAWNEYSGSRTIGGVDFVLSNDIPGCGGPRKRKTVGGTSDDLTYDCIGVEDQCSGTKTYTLKISNLANGDYKLLTYYNRFFSGWTNSQQIKVDGLLKAGPETAPFRVDTNNCLQQVVEFTVTGGPSQQVVIDWEEISNNGGPFICGFELTSLGALIQFDSDSSSASEKVSPAHIPVTLVNADPLQTYTVNYSVIGGTATGGNVDYTLADGTLTFPPGSTLQYINIAIVDDKLPEDDETIVIQLSAPTGPSTQLGYPIEHTFTIIDGSAAIQFEQAGGSSLETDTPVLIPVTLSEPLPQQVTVDYNVVGGTAENGIDYILDSGTLLFDVNQTKQNIILDVIPDSNDQEPPETIIIDLSNPANAKLGDTTEYTHTILSELIHLKVDFAMVDCDKIIRPETAKPGWFHWAAPRWMDMYAHDAVWENGKSKKPADAGIENTGIHAAITLIREGDLGMKVSGLTGALGGGICPTGSPIYEPICNSWLQCIDWPETEWGSIQLALHNLPAGEYILYSYHNHFGCYRGSSSGYTPVTCDCLCDVAPPMPEIRAMSCKEARNLPYQNAESWQKLFPGISWDTGPWPEGVVSIDEAYNVQPQQVTSDAELTPSVIRFSTDGSPVLVLYKAGCCKPDPVRPTRTGGRGILNAFELKMIIETSCWDCPLWALGDVNGDGYVSADDIVPIINNFGKSASANHCADLDKSGYINAADVVPIINNLGAGDGTPCP